MLRGGHPHRSRALRGGTDTAEAAEVTSITEYRTPNVMYLLYCRSIRGRCDMLRRLPCSFVQGLEKSLPTGGWVGVRGSIGREGGWRSLVSCVGGAFRALVTRGGAAAVVGGWLRGLFGVRSMAGGGEGGTRVMHGRGCGGRPGKVSRARHCIMQRAWGRRARERISIPLA